MPSVGEIVGDRYEIRGVLGQGAMGVVFSARHAITGKRVAVKILRPQALDNAETIRRFEVEAGAAARIGHKNIVDVYDAGTWHGLPYVVMEYLEGESLEARLRRDGPLSVETTMRILSPVFAAIHAAHRADVIHRDLKPENIFLCREPGLATEVPRVLDFGVSKILDPTRAQLTASGHTIGTALYMPFEQMAGAKDVTTASDVYALGVVVYECLTCEFPYEADSVVAIAIKMKSEPPVAIDSWGKNLPTGLGNAVMRALEHDHRARYQEVLDFAAALEPFGLVPIDSSATSRSGEFTRRPDWSASLRDASLLDTLPSNESARVADDLRASEPAVEPTPEPTREPASLIVDASRAPEPLPYATARRSRGLVVGSVLVAVLASGVAALAVWSASPDRVRSPSAPHHDPSTSIARRARIIVDASGHGGASVRVDRAHMEQLDDQGRSSIELEPGLHAIELVVDGVALEVQSVDARADTVVVVRFRPPGVDAPPAVTPPPTSPQPSRRPRHSRPPPSMRIVPPPPPNPY